VTPPTAPRLTFALKPFHRLTLMELHDVLRLRTDVFVVGQGITVEAEIDGLDPECAHVLGLDAAGEMRATARLFLGADPVKVGRVAVHPALQRRGVGTALMTFVHGALAGRRAAMSAQAHLVPWYERLGWTPVGPLYEEARIPHRRLERAFAPAPSAAGGGR
jgi:ElaA protein